MSSVVRSAPWLAVEAQSQNSKCSTGCRLATSLQMEINLHSAVLRLHCYIFYAVHMKIPRWHKVSQRTARLLPCHSAPFALRTQRTTSLQPWATSVHGRSTDWSVLYTSAQEAACYCQWWAACSQLRVCAMVYLSCTLICFPATH